MRLEALLPALRLGAPFVRFPDRGGRFLPLARATPQLVGLLGYARFETAQLDLVCLALGLHLGVDCPG